MDSLISSFYSGSRAQHHSTLSENRSDLLNSIQQSAYQPVFGVLNPGTQTIVL
jgi:hypothetical protein